MNVRALRFALAALVAVGFTTLSGGDVARAQLDPGLKSYGVYEDGILVGEIFREDLDAGRYTEHWVLYPDYVYPSIDNGVAVTIEPGLTSYRSTADFFERVPFARGSRYVATTCIDGTSLPGRR